MHPLLQTLYWTNSRVDVITKLREGSSSTLSVLSVMYANVYDKHAVAAAHRERRTWNGLHSLELNHDFYSNGHCSSAITLLSCDHFPNVQLLELLPGFEESWDACSALLQNCPSLKVLVFNTTHLRKPRPIALPVLDTVTTIGLFCRDVTSMDLNFTPNASTIVLIAHGIMQDKALERKLEDLYEVLQFIAGHKTFTLQAVKLKGVRINKV